MLASPSTKELEASGCLSSLMAIITLPLVSRAAGEPAHLSRYQIASRRRGHWRYLCSFVQQIFIEHLRAGSCAGGWEQIKKQNTLGLCTWECLSYGRDGDMCFAALTGPVPSAHETTSGLLYQPWQPRIGRDSGQASRRECYGSCGLRDEQELARLGLRTDEIQRQDVFWWKGQYFPRNWKLREGRSFPSQMRRCKHEASFFNQPGFGGLGGKLYRWGN